MSFPYKNPVSPTQIIGTESVSRDKTFGTNFSVLSVGGFMEVNSLENLYYTVPPLTTGPINYTGNTIPVTFSVSDGNPFSFDTLTLNSDNISSGRKKLGMLVYVREENQIYQYNINDYDNLWNAATGATGVGGSTVIISEFGTTVKGNTSQGLAFISGWTANTVDGISGETQSTAVWKKYYGNNLSITGGTYNTGTGVLTLVNITGGTINIPGISGGGGGSGITGGTIDYTTGTLSLNSTGGTVTITGFTDTFVTGGTYSNGVATFTNNYGNSFTVTGFTSGGTSGIDVFVTGGTYSNGTATFTNNTGGTFNVSGFYTGGTDVFVTGGTYSNGTATFTNNTGGTFDVTGFFTGETDDDRYTTGFTYNNNTFTLTDNSGNTLNATINDVTGLTINGDLIVTGSSFLNTITANTITNVDYIDFDITQTGTTSSPGRLFWDVNNRTLSVGMLSGVTQQIGEEQYYLVENQTTGTLSDGYVVRAAGTTGSSGKILIDYMIANGTIPAFTTMGVLTQTLLSGETGYVTSFGLVRNIDTTGTPYGESWNQGDVLYVSPTILGGFTKFRPIVPNQDIIIAIVMEVSVNGSIFVRPDVYRPFKDPQLITVAKQNADFTSIKDAVDSIVGSSISNRYVIEVGPGIFVEDEIDLTSTPYVSIVGSNIQTTLVVPSGSTQHVFKIGINNEISFLSISGASTGYAGLYCYDVGDFAQAHKVSFYDCDTNLWVESDTQDTKFYGEYMDFNGTYTYGTRVVGNNGFLALANMENYFNFPTGGNITYCNYATGSGATLNVFVSDNVSNGVSGTTAFLVQDGAQLNASTVTCDGNTYGIRNPNIGQPIRFDVDNASFVDGEWDLYVESSGTFGTFGGSSNHQKIFTNSTDIYWAFLDINDGEFDITRKASVTFTDGSHTDFTTLIFEGGSMGLLSGGSLTTISGFTVQADGGFGYLEKSDNSGIVRRIDWLNNQITLSANTDNYIYINENSNLVSSGGKPITSYNILLGRVVTNSTGVEFIDLSPLNAEHTSNRFDSLFTEALGPIFSTGSVVTEGTSAFTLDVTQGDYHFSTNEFLPSGGTPITFTQYYRNGTGSTWITTATTLVNNTQYDNNGTLTGLTNGYFTKHTLYTVGEGSYENYFLVLGQNEYPTLVQTENALLPTPPTYFIDGVVQIANIYIEQGTSGITQIEDIRPTIAFRAGGVNASSVHGNLLGLGADDHIQYLLVSGARAMSGNLDMGANDITNVGTVDGVIVSAHAIRHQFGGADPVGSVTPSANAIPYADVSGTLDSWISTATTTTFGKVKTSSSSSTVVSENDNRFLKSFTGGSFDYSSQTLNMTTVDGTSYPISGFSEILVTGFTYNNANTFSIFDNSGNTFSASINEVTGLTVNGTLSATTVSATTYQNYPTQNLEDTLGYGNSSGIYNISMGTGTTINSDNGGGQISLDFISTPNSVYISTDSGVGAGTFISLNNTSGSYGNATHGYDVKTNGTIIRFENEFTVNGFYNATASDNLIYSKDNRTTQIQTDSSLKPGVLIGTQSSYIDLAVTNSVVIGGSNITGNTSDTVFVSNLNIFNTPTNNNSNTQILSRNSTTGLIDYTSLSYITGFTPFDVFVTGGTYSSGTATFTNNTGGTFTVTGFLSNAVTATTLSSNILSVTSNGGTPTTTTINAATGGTYSNGTITLTGSGTLSTITGLFTGNTDVFVTGATYLNNTFTYTNNTGGTFSVLFNTVTGLTINGDLTVTGTTSSGTISATTYQNLPTDIRVTGGTYNNSTGTATFTNNTGGTFNVTGFSTGGTGTDTFVTGLTYSANVLTLSQNQGQPNLTATIGLRIKSGTVTAASFTGTPRKATVTFSTAYPTTAYSIGITGSDNRTFTYESKTTTGFVINTNANTALTGNVDWQTIATGES